MESYNLGENEKSWKHSELGNPDPEQQMFHVFLHLLILHLDIQIVIIHLDYL